MMLLLAKLYKLEVDELEVKTKKEKKRKTKKEKEIQVSQKTIPDSNNL